MLNDGLLQTSLVPYNLNSNILFRDYQNIGLKDGMYLCKCHKISVISWGT